MEKEDKIWALGNLIKAMRGSGYPGYYDVIVGNRLKRMGIEEASEEEKITEGKYYDEVLTEIMHDLGNPSFPTLAEIQRRFHETGD